MQSRFTSKAQEALNYAADTAAMLGHGYIGSEHLLDRNSYSIKKP